MLANQVTLRHRDEALRLSVFTDASDSFWYVVLTQVSPVKTYYEQIHGPPAFISGLFESTKLGWSVLEKLAYEVLVTVSRMCTGLLLLRPD